MPFSDFWYSIDPQLIVALSPPPSINPIRVRFPCRFTRALHLTTRISTYSRGVGGFADSSRSALGCEEVPRRPPAVATSERVLFDPLFCLTERSFCWI